MNFLKENWAWIVVPILLVAALVVAVVVLGSSGENPHDYTLR